MTERQSTEILEEKIDTFDSLDVALSEQMENEGCPNPGLEIIVGTLAKREIPHETAPGAAAQEKS